eukprot:TRINITY_DN1874_c0_g1_i8.p2 TRINITY_DN1874_c0_g1~~TRINITY_DN1874_c0_g1_i8.p2  ORF type:complete len:687 (+),score=84.21 TRINITY_DN1874_c0_g1_i8:2329-4389(+)
MLTQAQICLVWIYMYACIIQKMELWQSVQENLYEDLAINGGDFQQDIGANFRSFLNEIHDKQKQNASGELVQETSQQTYSSDSEEEEVTIAEEEDDEEETEEEESDEEGGSIDFELKDEGEDEGGESIDKPSEKYPVIGHDGRIKLRLIPKIIKQWTRERKEKPKKEKKFYRALGCRFHQLELDRKKSGYQTLEPPGKLIPEQDFSDLVQVDPLNIVIMVVGTRGDVQPFVALGRRLKEFGHRVRLATHAIYRDFVQTFGLEFYPLGGDPALLAEYVARNKGILPNHVVGATKEIRENYEQIRDILHSTYPACTEPDPESDSTEKFNVQVIISNPPAYGHIHCAEKLGVHLHMMFTMPWTETKEFGHPMARVGDFDFVSGVDTSVKLFVTKAQRKKVHKKLNRFSYYAIERITWSGFGDLINDFRENTLGLDPLSNYEGPRALHDFQPPWTYCWSPALVPKPADWAENIDVVGFFFLNQSKVMDYEPPPDLQEFIDAGDPPVYIGFGSMPVMYPQAVTEIIYQAVRNTGTRVILSKGAKKKGQEFFLGEGVDDQPEGVHVIGPVPHDWLFQHCSGVVHHGGAGTTAAGLIEGCPTFVVPFFGDQPFWGQRIAKAGVGPPPCPIGRLNAETLTDAFDFFRRPAAIKNAQKIAESIQHEDGIQNAIWSFYKNLPDDLIHVETKAQTGD